MNVLFLIYKDAFLFIFSFAWLINTYCLALPGVSLVKSYHLSIYCSIALALR